MMAPAPRVWTDRDGTDWQVWDVLEGRRVAPGQHVTDQRLFVRVDDRAAFTCSRNPRAGPWPTTTSYPQWQLDRALEGSPVRRTGEDDATYAARDQAHRAARTAYARAYQQRLWDEAAARGA